MEQTDNKTKEKRGGATFHYINIPMIYRKEIQAYLTALQEHTGLNFSNIAGAILADALRQTVKNYNLDCKIEPSTKINLFNTAKP